MEQPVVAEDVSTGRKTRSSSRLLAQASKGRRDAEDLPQQPDSTVHSLLTPEASINHHDQHQQQRQRQPDPPDVVNKPQNGRRDQQADNFQPTKRRKLTKPNLRALQSKISSSHLPKALSEWKDVIERTSIFSANNKMANTKNTTRTGKTTTEGGLKGNPAGYAIQMMDYGVMQYDHREPWEGSVDDSHVVSTHIPSNYAEIREALKQDRQDAPNRQAFREYCLRAQQNFSAPEESDIGPIFELFLKVSRWNGAYFACGRQALSVPPDTLPSRQKLLKPDMCIGITPLGLRQYEWTRKYIGGYIRNEQLIAVNGLVEYKSGLGNMAAAVAQRISNCAAAKLLCTAWLEDEEMLAQLSQRKPIDAPEAGAVAATLPSGLPSEVSGPGHGSGEERWPSSAAAVAEIIPGNAFVGSIAFDGNCIEASVHWLGKSMAPARRRFEVLSMRVATGNPFAADLEEYQQTWKKFANFLDWLAAVRTKRLDRIKALPSSEPMGYPLPDRSFMQSSDADDDDEEIDGPGGRADGSSKRKRG